MSRIRAGWAAVAMGVVVATAGCVAVEPAPTSTPRASATSSTTPTPSPSPDAAVRLTCDELVDPDVIAGFDAGGMQRDNLWPADTANYGTLHLRFAEFGGVSCRWGKPNSDNVSILSYAPTTPQQSALLESELTMAGYRTEARDRGVLYISPEVPGTFFLVTGDEVFEVSGNELFEVLIPYRE